MYYIYTAISEHQPVYPIEDRWAIALNLIQHVVQFWRPLCSVIWLPGSGLSWQPSGLLAWWYMATGSPPIPWFKHPWKRKSHLSLLPIIIYIPIFHADLTIPGTSGCFSRSIPFSKMAQRIISAADCQIYCDICKYTSGNAHFDSLIDACNKINVSKKNVWSYKQSISDVILACQCHKYSTKDLWTKFCRSIRQLSPFQWQKQHLTDSLGKSPVANHLPSPACQSANSIGSFNQQNLPQICFWFVLKDIFPIGA